MIVKLPYCVLDGWFGQATISYQLIDACSKIHPKSQDRSVIVNNSRRRLIKLLSVLPLAGSFLFRRASLAEQQLGNNHVLVNGWILKKSDLVSN